MLPPIDYQETDNWGKKKAATLRVAAFTKKEINPSICNALACMGLLEEPQYNPPALSLASLTSHRCELSVRTLLSHLSA
jgi:hypothetical protein